MITMRQAEMLAHAITGKRDKEIAELCNVLPKTVKCSLSRSYKILGVKSRYEATFLYYTNKLPFEATQMIKSFIK